MLYCENKFRIIENAMKKLIFPILSLVLISSCNTAKFKNNQNRLIELNALPEGISCHRISSVESSDGYGCGGMGQIGLYNTTIRNIRIKAKQVNANVFIKEKEEKPFQDGNCFINRYRIIGTLYQCKLR